MVFKEHDLQVQTVLPFHDYTARFEYKMSYSLLSSLIETIGYYKNKSKENNFISAALENILLNLFYSSYNIIYTPEIKLKIKQ